ncbi:MAG: nicotinate-nucleotide adenylyltransferase [Hyphomicrobiaceae bacterium]|nr:nicotinate-nucleotide adenylyltransferase [Hyphomicrobiaceae bacterium]
MLRRPVPIAVATPPAAEGMRIGLMGGSFNPPHAGHLVAAATAMKKLRLDRLWWLVTPGNPLKARAGLASLEARVEAIDRLVRDPRQVVTTFEAELGTAFTAETIGFLVARFPASRFVWVMGADNLATFHHWQNWRGIADAVPIAVVDRPHHTLAALASPAARALARHRIAEAEARLLPDREPPAWVFLTCRRSALSSTLIREQGGNM